MLGLHILSITAADVMKNEVVLVGKRSVITRILSICNPRIHLV